MRVRILAGDREEIANLDARERQITHQLAELASRSGSTLGQLCGLATVSVPELLVEIGDARRFTIGGFGRFNGTAPLAASAAEAPGEPIRHRYNPGGNRRVNAVLHRIAPTQLRYEPRAKEIYADARATGIHDSGCRRASVWSPLAAATGGGAEGDDRLAVRRRGAAKDRRCRAPGRAADTGREWQQRIQSVLYQQLAQVLGVGAWLGGA